MADCIGSAASISPPSFPRQHVSPRHHLELQRSSSNSSAKSVECDEFVRYTDNVTGFRRASPPIESPDNSNGDLITPSIDDSLGARLHPHQSPIVGTFRDQTVRTHSAPALSQKRLCQANIFDGNEKSRDIMFGSADDVRKGYNGQSEHTTRRSSRVTIGCMRDLGHGSNVNTIESFAESLQLQLIEKGEQIAKCEKERKKSEEKVRELQEYIDSGLHINSYGHQQSHSRVPNLSAVAGIPKEISDFENVRNGCFKNFHENDTGLKSFLSCLSTEILNNSQNERLIPLLKNCLRSHWSRKSSDLLDIPDREWCPGKEYVLIGDTPMNCSHGGHSDKPLSLVFRIKHKDSYYALKVRII